MAAVAAPVAIIFALGGSAHAENRHGKADAVADVSCCHLQITAAEPTTAAWAASDVQANGAPAETAPASRASRWHVASKNAPQVLIADIAPEHGLQVKTILAARTISAVFPEIKSMGGVRPDALRWHPEGLAIDVMIPNPSSAAGIALGNQIVSFALKNADKFSLQDCIWRGTYYTPKRAVRIRLRPLRPRPHHHPRRRIPQGRGSLHPLKKAVKPRPARPSMPNCDVSIQTSRAGAGFAWSL